MSRLQPFPVDPESLDLIEAAMTTYGPDGASSLLSTLDLLSGDTEDDGLPVVYSTHDVILALIAEVRTLRIDTDEDTNP